MVVARSPIARSSLPLHVLTGFLGSGKTTILRALLRGGAERIAVLVNDVDDLGLDHRLLERIDEDLLMLPGGCVCCSLRGELHAALERVLEAEPRRIVLETTGLADPGPLLGSLVSDPRLAGSLELRGLVAVVDCLRAEDLLSEHPEVRRQLDFCDRVVLTKSDLAPHRRERVLEALRQAAPGREVATAIDGAVDPDWLLARSGFAAEGLRDWLRRVPEVEPSADDARHLPYATRALRHSRPVDVEALGLWLRLVAQIDGPRLLRVKAVVRSAADGSCWALQSAGRAVSPPTRVARAPEDLAGAEVSIVARGLEEDQIERLLASLRSALETPSAPERSQET